MGEVAMSTFAERLKELRFRKRISQKELAQKIGVSPSTVAAWEVGRNEPNYDMLKKLADFFGVSVDYLVGLTDDPAPRKPDWAIELRPIPVYNGASAGTTGSFPDGANVVRWIMVPVNKPGKFGVIVHGDSMEPEIHDGDIVVVDPDLVVDNGSLALVILEDEAYVKKVYFQDSLVVLQSLNPRYPPITVPARKLKMYLVGKVVMVVKEYV